MLFLVLSGAVLAQKGPIQVDFALCAGRQMKPNEAHAAVLRVLLPGWCRRLACTRGSTSCRVRGCCACWRAALGLSLTRYVCSIFAALRSLWIPRVEAAGIGRVAVSLCAWVHRKCSSPLLASDYRKLLASWLAVYTNEGKPAPVQVLAHLGGRWKVEEDMHGRGSGRSAKRLLDIDRALAVDPGRPAYLVHLRA